MTIVLGCGVNGLFQHNSDYKGEATESEMIDFEACTLETPIQICLFVQVIDTEKCTMKEGGTLPFNVGTNNFTETNGITTKKVTFHSLHFLEEVLHHRGPLVGCIGSECNFLHFQQVFQWKLGTVYFQFSLHSFLSIRSHRSQLRACIPDFHYISRILSIIAFFS